MTYVQQWAEDYARHYAGYAILRQAFTRRHDRLVIEVSETLMLEPDGSTRGETETRIVGAQMVACRVLRWLDIPAQLREGRTTADLPAPSGTLLPTELRWLHHWCTTPVYEPMSDDALLALQAKERPYLGVISQWPSDVTSGHIGLSGSKDRWVIALGQGGTLKGFSGAYQTAQEATAALRQYLEMIQQTIAEVIAQRAIPDKVRCEFPPARIDVLGDTTYVAPPLSNRAARRAAMAELGHAGGSVTSERKAAASRANGCKGGRPRKTA